MQVLRRTTLKAPTVTPQLLTLRTMSSLFEFKVSDLKGQPFDLKKNCEGKLVIIVNVASKCGFTPQYTGLEKLYKDYKDKGLIILGFPCNQFGAQEPGSSDEIATFCSTKYQVSFPVLEKVDVNGDDAHPLYKYLKSQKKQLMMERIKWNFEKFVVDARKSPPVVVERYASTTTPESIGKDVAKLLA